MRVSFIATLVNVAVTVNAVARDAEWLRGSARRDQKSARKAESLLQRFLGEGGKTAETTTTTTTAMPTDIPSVVARFKVMAEQVTNLTRDVASVQLEMLDASKVAEFTDVGVNESEQTIKYLEVVAANNTNKSLAIKADALKAAKTVAEVGKEMKSMEKGMATLMAATQSLDGSSGNVGTQIFELEDDVKELLPGKDGELTKRVKKAEGAVDSYKAALKAGLEKDVAKDLRRTFRRARLSVENITEQVVLKAQDGNGDADDTTASA